MAHFAEIDSDNIVVRVLVTDNNAPKEGLTWLKNTFGGTWIKTSYNTAQGIHSLGGTPLRKNFAGVGYTFDKERDAFIPPKPFSSWVLNEETCLWKAPVPHPDSDDPFIWSEEDLNWVPEG